jgi:integrase
MKFLPERGSTMGEDIIFPLSANGYTNQVLNKTVSKLLGHADIQTIQIYTKVIDKNKRETVSKLDGLTN